MRWRWMPITCGGRTPRSSGRAERRMGAEAKRDSRELTIRACREADAAAVTEILRASPEASQWTGGGFRELLGWRGVLARVAGAAPRVTGFRIVRARAAGG